MVCIYLLIIYSSYSFFFKLLYSCLFLLFLLHPYLTYYTHTHPYFKLYVYVGNPFYSLRSQTVVQTWQPNIFQKGDLDFKFILGRPNFTAPQSVTVKNVWQESLNWVAFVQKMSGSWPNVWRFAGMMWSGCSGRSNFWSENSVNWLQLSAFKIAIFTKTRFLDNFLLYDNHTFTGEI